MKKYKKRMLATVLVIALGIATGMKGAPNDALAQNESGVYHGTEAKTEVVYEALDFKVRYTLTSQWEGGYNANVEIENTGEFVIDNWYLTFPSRNEFTSVWNAEVAWYEEGRYVIKNADWNQDIAPGQKVSFGISCNETFAGFPELYELLGRNKLMTGADYYIGFRVENSWEDGFTGEITITNHMEEALEDWSLGFLYDGEITELWNGEIVEKVGNRYLLENAGYNGNIAPGQTVTVGFNGVKGTEAAEPYDYQLFSYRMSDFEEAEIDETLDSDLDGVPDYLEDYFGTNIAKTDTDDDGLSDYLELMVLRLDPLTKDTDGNGVKDDDEDTDGDGCSNRLELSYGTDVVKTDTDSDGITDYDELMRDGTDALCYDTDEDGASDGMERLLGTNPKAAEETFSVSISGGAATVNALVRGAQIEMLALEEVADDIIFSSSIPGYMGDSYLFVSEGNPINASISIDYGTEFAGAEVVPTIYGFYDDTLVLEELNTVVDGTVVSAEMGDYSRYVLLDKAKFEASTTPATFIADCVYGANGTPMFRASRAVSDKDYDGQADNVDAAPLNNSFTGTLKTEFATSSVSFNMDYRWFFRDNKVYNPALSKLSAILSSVVYKGGALSIRDSVNVRNVNNQNLSGVLSYLGMNSRKIVTLEKEDYLDNHLSEAGLGYRTVSYNGQEKNIVAVVVRGTNKSIEEWSSNFDIGDYTKVDKLSDWEKAENHAGFDVAANRIMDEIEAYVKANGLNESNTVYWITGHSRGAAIANIIGAYYEKGGKTAFTYTFATPNTTLDTSAKNYRTIFNVVNTDDLVPYMPMAVWGYSRYGRTAEKSIADSYEKEWENLTDIFDYNPDTIGMDDVIKKLGGIAQKDARVNCYKYTCKHHGDGSNNTITITNYGMSKNSRENAIAKIPENATPYCKITRYDGRFIAGWDFDVCQTPAYFMQILAAVMSEEIGYYRFAVELNIADRYESAKSAIVAAALGGVKHPHYPESYYILSNHVTAGDF